VKASVNPPRYAAYWAPARDHPLWDAGCAWLGRDAERADRSWPLREHTDVPRGYGFHATLKAPQHLATDVTPRMWLDRVASIAASTAPFQMPPLEVRLLGDFVALRPAVDPDASHPLRRLADRCVLELDSLRGPAIAADIARRIEGLDARLAGQARRFGYPYVLDDWRFHMTLTNSLPSPAVLKEAARLFFTDVLALPLRSDELAVFIQPHAGAPFVLAHRIALTGTHVD